MEQNRIAIIWDFDKTLSKNYMQKPLFDDYGVDEKIFWDEVNALYDKYKEQGISVNKDTAYLNHLLTCVRQGIFPELNNAKLFVLGEQIEFYDGVLEIFDNLRQVLKNTLAPYPLAKDFDIQIEYYIVSTGLTQMIKGSKIAKHITQIWGCEFIESPIPSNLKGIKQSKVLPSKFDTNIINQVSYLFDNTSKTRAIFEINKGSNKLDTIDVNGKMDDHKRRIPFVNMIYLADGPSDVPAFSLLTKNNGKTYAVYPKGAKEHRNQVNQLQRDGRIDAFGEADYTPDTPTYLWLEEQVQNIALKIYNNLATKFQNSTTKSPTHLVD